MGQEHILSSLAALPLAEATRICLDFVELLNANNPALQHQLESILKPPKSTTLPELEAIWDKEATRRQDQNNSLVAEVIKNKEGIDISRALHCLRPSAGLNDEIINQYLSLVQESAPKNVLVASTWLVKRLRNSNFDRKDGAGLLRLIIPVHHPRSHPSKQHWTLAILERECQEDRFRLVLLDSLCQQNITIPNLLELWLADLDLSEISVATPNPQQNYFSQDCGLFVLLAARLAASGVPMPSQVEVRHLMRSFRRRVLAEILAGKLDPAISDFEKFQENEKERQIEACTLKNFHQDVRKPLAIVLEGGKEFVNLISPITTTSSGDMIATGSFNSNTWEPSSTIDPKILSYQLPYSTMESAVGQNDEENTPKSLQIESMFVSSPETDKETVASPGESSVRSMPGLPTPAPSRSSSPVRCTPSECSTPHSAASPQSSSSSSHISSQSSNPGSPSSDGNTTISRGSLPKLGISSECSVGASSDRYAKTCRKSPHILAVPSECSTPDSASSDEPSQSPSSVASLETTPMKPLPIAWRMTVPLALDDLEALPSILESARTDHEEGAITISLPEANAYSQVDIDITHSTMVQSLTFHKWVITNNFETVEKQTRITLQPQSRMDIDPVGLEELVLLFEEHVQKGELTELDYVTDVLVTSRESRKQLDLPSSKITNPVGNALRYTSGRFDGIHTPMAYLSGGYGTCFSAHIEDYSLCSMNYLWYGAPKVWVVIPPRQKLKFETLVRDMTKTRKKCSQFVRHEGVYLPLGIMKRAGIEYQIIIQHPGELVFTFADTYHQGFNLGPNLAEAINYATDLRNIAADLPCSSICPGGERIPQSGMLRSEGGIIKRRLLESPVELAGTAKKPRMSVDLLASFAHPSTMAHTLQHAIAAKRRSTQTMTASLDLLRLWQIVNTNSSLHILESRWFREKFAREWMRQWESRPKRCAGHYMRQELGFQDCFPNAQKAAKRARIWVELCDIFRVDLGDDCIVVMCAVAEITSTAEQLGRPETIDFLQEVANRKHRVLPLLKAIVPTFQYILGLRKTLPTLPIEKLDVSGDLMVKELADLSLNRFQQYFKM